MKVKLLVADDHPIVRSGIRTEISKHPDFEIIGEAVTGDQVLEWADKSKIDLVVLDIIMPGTKTIDVLKQLKKRYPAVKVLILSAHIDKSTVTSFLSAGAEGFISKDEDPNIIPEAIRSILNGKNWLSPVVSTLVIEQLNRPRPRKESQILTNREVTVLKMVADGLTSKEIASELNTAERTVEFHLTNIYEKLGANSRASAVNKAKERDLI